MLSKEEKLKFEKLCHELPKPAPGYMGIGTQSEKTLHRVLKHYVCPDTDCHEVSVGGHIADAVVGDTIYEIQCAGFFPLKKKLASYLENTDKNIVLVCPFVISKTLTWIEPDSGEMSKPRKTSVGYGKMRILPELIYLLEFLDFSRVTLMPVGLSVEDYRLRDGYGKDKKKRATKAERIPSELCSIEKLTSKQATAACFFPQALADSFTAAEFSKATHLRRRALSAALKVLLALDAIEIERKEGKRIFYRKRGCCT